MYTHMYISEHQFFYLLVKRMIVTSKLSAHTCTHHLSYQPKHFHEYSRKQQNIFIKFSKAD